VVTNLAQGQSHLYSISWLISLEADTMQYVLYGAYKEWRSERRCWYQQAFTSPAFAPSCHSHMSNESQEHGFMLEAFGIPTYRFTVN
jgi:hypothetical protein